MAEWAQGNFQDRASRVAELLGEFHDFTLLVVGVVLAGVRAVIAQLARKTFINKTLAVHHVLEFAWTSLPVLVLLLIAIPSLTLLFMIEDASGAYVRTKVLGYQWYWAYEPMGGGGGGGARERYLVGLERGGKGLFRLLDTRQALTLPVDTPARMLITSSDVLHS